MRLSQIAAFSRLCLFQIAQGGLTVREKPADQA